MGLFGLQQKIAIGNKFEKFVSTTFSFLKLCSHLTDVKFLTGNVTCYLIPRCRDLTFSVNFHSSPSNKEDPKDSCEGKNVFA